MRSSIIAFFFATTLLTSLGSAQIMGPGLFWISPSATAGGYGSDCTVHAVDALRGENVMLSVWGDHGAPFAVALSPATIPCAPIPGVAGWLTLPTAVPCGNGMLDTISPCLACPRGMHELHFSIPAGAPVGMNVAFQMVTVAAGTIALSTTIEATVL